MTDQFAGLSPPYRTIVADPPWRYAKVQQPAVAPVKSTAESQYSTLSNPEIAALPVGMLAAADAHLYLWVTNPRLFGERRSREVSPADIMEGWGFQYMTMLTWIKKPGSLGMGFYFRGETEHVLFGVRGRLPVPVADRQPNWFMAGKHRHSEKPAAFFDLVERVSPGPYVELFARQPRLGWDSWGLGFEQEA